MMTPGATDVDERILVQAARGSTDALAEVFVRYRAVAYRTALGLTRNTADAEDVVQDVFVALPEALERYDAARPFEPWLRRVTARAALSRMRSEERRERRHAVECRHARNPSPSPLDRIILEHAVAKLPLSLRAVLLLREVEGFTHEEIAGLLGITPAASATRLSRAWTRLRWELEP
jgi:RNA polymerase sigma factor (sigma-70 family)